MTKSVGEVETCAVLVSFAAGSTAVVAPDPEHPDFASITRFPAHASSAGEVLLGLLSEGEIRGVFSLQSALPAVTQVDFSAPTIVERCLPKRLATVMTISGAIAVKTQ